MPKLTSVYKTGHLQIALNVFLFALSFVPRHSWKGFLMIEYPGKPASSAKN